jgi:hypothetical protein
VLLDLVEDLAGAISRCRSLASHHQGYFAHPVVQEVQLLHTRHGPALNHLLFNPVVSISKACQLGKVGHTNHLAPRLEPLREPPKLLAYRLSYSTTNALVDLIKDQGGGLICTREDG